VSGLDPAIANQFRADAMALLHRLCDEAGIARSNRHEDLEAFIHGKFKNSKEGDQLFPYRREAPAAETLKKDLLRGIPGRPIRATERRVHILDSALNAHGSYVAICERYWKALHPPQPGNTEVWFQITFPEYDPVHGPLGRLFTAVDIAEFESHGEEIQVDYHRIAPEEESSLGLRWKSAGFQREGYRFLAFASMDSVRNRSLGAVALRLVGDAREEHYEGFYFRPGDPAASYPLQLERRRVAWFKTVPLGAFPHIALLDWDNSLHEGWTLVPWAEFLSHEGYLNDNGALPEKLRELLSAYPARASHDELAVQTSEMYAQAISNMPRSALLDAARRFVSDPRRFRPRPWTDSFLRGLRDLGIAPVIISGAPAEVLAAWVTPRKDFIAACFGLDAPNAASAALSNEFIPILAGTGNPATTEGKRKLVDQIRRMKRRVVLAVGDSASDIALWEAADNRIYVGTVMRPEFSAPSALILDAPNEITASALTDWVLTRIGPWDAAAP
jgi:phosphoserine phosphatase